MATSLNISKKISFYEYLFYSTTDFVTRTYIVRDLNKIPSTSTSNVIVNLIKELLTDDRVENYRKYSFLMQFDATIVDECQIYFFFVSRCDDDEYKIKSAQYIFEHVHGIGNDMDDVEEYLISKLPSTKSFLDSMRWKARIYGQTIEEKKTSLKSISKDKQNIHNSLISKQARIIVRNLFSSYKGDIKDRKNITNTINIFMKNGIYTKETDPSIKRIITDAVVFEDLTLIEIFFLVLNEFNDLVEEKKISLEDSVNIIKSGLVEMSGKCFMGHAIRIVNMLSGVSEKYSLSISAEEQYKNRLFTLCTKLFSSLGDSGLYGEDMLKEIEKSTIRGELGKEDPTQEWFEKYSKLFCGL
jgi:hypothetical protein